MNILLTMKRVVFKSSFQICVLCNVVSVSCGSRWCKKGVLQAFHPSVRVSHLAGLLSVSTVASSYGSDCCAYCRWSCDLILAQWV